MGTEREVIELKIVDKFSQSLKSFSSGVKGAGDALGNLKSANTGLIGAFGQTSFALNQLFGTVGYLTSGFQQLYGVITDFGQIGAQAEKNAIAFTALAGSSAEASRWIRELQTATRGAITEGEAAAQAYQLMKFGLADSADAAGQFLKEVSVLAQISPTLGDTSEAINQIQLTLANMSYMRLDQLGLSVQEVKARMKDLRDETAGMSQEQAFQEAVLEGIHQQYEIVGDDILKVDSNQAELAAKWRQFKEDIGKPINTGLEAVAGELLDIIASLEDIQNFPPIKITIDIVNAAGDVWDATGLGGQIMSGGKQATGAAAAVADFIGFSGKTGIDIDATDPMIQQLASIAGNGLVEELYTATTDYGNENVKLLVDALGPGYEDTFKQLGFESGEAFWFAFMNATSAEAFWQGVVGGGYSSVASNALASIPPSREAIASMNARPTMSIGPTLAAQMSGRGAYSMGPSTAGRMSGVGELDLSTLLALFGGSTSTWRNPAIDFYYGLDDLFQTGRGLQAGTLQMPSSAFPSMRDYIEYMGWSGGPSGPGITDLMQGAGDFAFEASQRAQFGTQAGFDKLMDFLGPGMEQGIGALKNKFGATADALGDMADAAGQAADRMQSLESFWGTGATSFDQSVYSEFSDALRDVGVDGDMAAEALKAYELNTGMANAASEIYRTQLRKLVEAYDAGEISVYELIEAQDRLANTDFSWVDKLLGAGGFDLEYRQGAIETLAENPEAFTTLTSGISGMISQLAGGGEEGATPASAFDPTAVRDFASEVDLAKGTVQTASEEMVTSVSTVTTAFQESAPEWTAAVGTYASDASAKHEEAFAPFWTNAEEAETWLAEVTTGEYQVTLSVSDSAGSGGGSDVPSYQYGGYTGRGHGPQGTIVRVHDDEYIIPGAQLRAGGGGGDTPIHTELTIQLDSKTVYKGMQRLAGKRRQTIGVPQYMAGGTTG